jgi:hypothetical protein
MFEVEPVANELLSSCAFALGNLVLVLGKNEIDATCVQIESFA